MPDTEPIPATSFDEHRLNRAVLDSLSINMAVLDQHGLIIFVNQAWLKFATENGAAALQLAGVGVNYLEVARQAKGPYAEEAIPAWQGIKSVLAGSRPEFSLKYPCHSASQQRWFLLQVLPVSIPGSGSVVVSHQDITAQKQASDLLRFSELRYRRLFETASDGILILDAQSGEVLDVNSFLIDLLGCSLRDILGRKFWEVPELKAIAGDEAAFQLLRNQDFVHLEHLTLVTHHGHQHQVEFVSTAYLADFKRVIQANIRDITARRQAETALVESQLRLEQALKAARLGPWEWDLTTNRLHYSQEWKNQIGHLNDHFSNELSEWESRLHPEDHDRVMAEMAACLSGITENLDLEFRLRHKDGSHRWINSRSQLFRDAAGKPSRLLGCHLDITERKSLEDQFRQAQKLESIGRLAGGVAHDFNNLLTIILGYSDILLGDTYLNEVSRDSLSEIRKAAERAAALTHQLLAFSRKQVLEPAILDLNGVVHDCEKMLLRLLGEDIELINHLAPDLNPVKADAGQLEQVLMNLVINARDAMPGGGRVTIETTNVRMEAALHETSQGARPGNYVLLSVSDTGTGMDEETKNRIFEPFFTTKPLGQGTGLGLAMVFGFIKQSGGHVSVLSEPGHGSTFKIFLPGAGPKSIRDKSAAHRLGISVGTETILLVEDEDGVRNLARLILESRGYTVLVAAQSDAALSLAKTHPGPIDLLVTDVVMPGMDGRHLAEEVKGMRPEVKTLFISGYTDDTVMRHGIQTSNTAFLQKPFAVEALPAKVRKVLDS